MDPKNEKRKKDAQASRLLLICVAVGFILWAIGGAIGRQFSAGWDEILQGSLVLIWIVVGGIWYAKKIKTLH